MNNKDKLKILYLGLEPLPELYQKGEVTHVPIIQIVPLPQEMQFSSSEWTHLIFTSKTSVALFFQSPLFPPQMCIILAVGKATKQALEERGLKVAICPQQESQEGLIEELQKLDLSHAQVFFPHSALARPLISNYFKEKKISCTEWILYTSQLNPSVPALNLTLFDQIFFTSPSTVEAFFKLYPTIPVSLECMAIGPVTKKSLESILPSSHLTRIFLWQSSTPSPSSPTHTML